MNVSTDGVTLDPTELDDLIRTMIDASRVHFNVPLAWWATKLTSIASAIAVELTLPELPCTMTVECYARSKGMSARTVRYQCKHQSLNGARATKVEGRWTISPVT